MGQTNRRASAWPSLAVLLAVLLSAMQPAIADDTPEQLKSTLGDRKSVV